MTPPSLRTRARSLLTSTTKLLAVGAAPALALTLLTPTTGVTTTATTAAEPKPISVLATGAVSDDGRDDLAAFKEAVKIAKAQGRAVAVPRGVFHLSGVLVLDGVAMKGVHQKRTTVISTDTSAGSIDLIGTGPELRNLTHVVPGVAVRSPEPGRQNINVKYATGFTVAGVHAIGSRGAGMLIRRSHGGLIHGNTVEHTLADGIHMTSGSSDITVRRNLTLETGDDGIAVVSYKKDGEVSRNVRIYNNQVLRSHARGVTVVGGEDVRILRNDVIQSESGGIYVAAEIEWNTFGVRRVQVLQNLVSGSPTRNSHASILVYSSEMVVDDVRFVENTVRGATNVSFGSWDHETNGGQIGNLYYTRNVVDAQASSAWARSHFKRGTIHRNDNVGF